MKILQQPQLALTPAQEQAFAWLLGTIPVADVLVLRGGPGTGKTTILERVRAKRGGALLCMRRQSTEDTLLHTIERALEAFDLVMVDNLHVIRRAHSRDQSYLFDAALTAILAEAAVQRKKLIFGTEGDAPWPILRRARSSEIVD